MASYREVPRLTNYIRAYGNVSAPWSGQHTQDPEALVRKRRERNEKLANIAERLYGFGLSARLLEL